MANYCLIAARADALFASDMSAGSYPTVAEVCTAIRQALRAHGGARGCRGEVAAAFGDYPEVAVMRMRWARQVVLSACMPSSATAASVAGELPEVALVCAASDPSHLRVRPRMRRSGAGQHCCRSHMKEVNHMHPHQVGQLADDRRRQMSARAEEGYLAGHLLALARAARRAERAERRLRRALRRTLRLRSQPEQ